MELLSHFRLQILQLTSSLFLHLESTLCGSPNLLLFFLLFAAPMEILHHHPHEHVQHKKPNQQNESNKIQQTPLIEIHNRLLIDTDRIQTGVHNVHPAVTRRQHKQRHQRFAQIVKIVLSIDPHISGRVQTVRLIFDLFDVDAFTVEKCPFEQLHAQYTEYDKERTTDQNNVADGSQR